MRSSLFYPPRENKYLLVLRVLSKMAVPFLLFPGLTAGELVAFEVVQTGLNVAIFSGLALVVTWAIEHDAWNQNGRARYAKSVFLKNLMTVLGIELSNLGVALSWYVLVMSVLVGLAVLFILYFGIPFFIMYLRDYRKGSFPEWRVIVHYVAVYVPALVASAAITWGIFTSAGVDVYFIFAF
ncbi:MAG: hypothetical protein Q6373_006360 [Candidatus Sigynarchaeota archaeon]